eukprot:g8566.t1
MLTCGDTDPQTGKIVDPWRRLHYVKESNTNMWYKCCEQRDEDRFVYNAGPPPIVSEGPWIPGMGPLHGLAKEIQDEMMKIVDFGATLFEQALSRREPDPFAITGGMFGAGTMEKTMEKLQLATIKTSCTTGKACAGKSYTDLRVKYNMAPARFLRCALMENLKTHADAFGRRKAGHMCGSFKRKLADAVLQSVSGATRTIFKKLLSHLPFQTGCRGNRFACLQPYDGMGKRFRINLEQPVCVDTGFRNEPWTFPHTYIVTYL